MTSKQVQSSSKDPHSHPLLSLLSFSSVTVTHQFDLPTDDVPNHTVIYTVQKPSQIKVMYIVNHFLHCRLRLQRQCIATYPTSTWQEMMTMPPIVESPEHNAAIFEEKASRSCPVLISSSGDIAAVSVSCIQGS